MIQTKNYYLNTMSQIRRGEQPLFGLGYSLDIPANDIYSTGWQFERPNTWGMEQTLITRPDPEYFAPDGIIRSNVLPQINPNDPIYEFNRLNHTYNLASLPI